MLTSGPFLALVLPFMDMADLPPLETPPMPMGASRIETQAGWFVATDLGFEVEAGLVGAGYLVRFGSGEKVKRGTLATRVATTWFTPDDSEMPMDRYWIGPFVRLEGATELMGRHEGVDFGTVNRAVADLGFRFALGPTHPSAGSIGIGYGVALDRAGTAYAGLKHGIRLQADFALR